MSLSQSIYDYIRDCPLIDSGTCVRFNRLGPEPQEFSVEDVPEDVIVKRYIGSSLRQKTFHLVSREVYNQDQRINIEKSDFYEDFQAWVEKENRLKHFPALTGDNRATKIECLTCGYLYTTEEDTALYQIQLRLTYLHKAFL